jgi:hypothetical protein
MPFSSSSRSLNPNLQSGWVSFWRYSGQEKLERTYLLVTLTLKSHFPFPGLRQPFCGLGHMPKFRRASHEAANEQNTRKYFRKDRSLFYVGMKYLEHIDLARRLKGYWYSRQRIINMRWCWRRRWGDNEIGLPHRREHYLWKRQSRCRGRLKSEAKVLRLRESVLVKADFEADYSVRTETDFDIYCTVL